MFKSMYYIAVKEDNKYKLIASREIDIPYANDNLSYLNLISKIELEIEKGTPINKIKSIIENSEEFEKIRLKGRIPIREFNSNKELLSYVEGEYEDYKYREIKFCEDVKYNSFPPRLIIGGINRKEIMSFFIKFKGKRTNLLEKRTKKENLDAILILEFYCYDNIMRKAFKLDDCSLEYDKQKKLFILECNNRDKINTVFDVNDFTETEVVISNRRKIEYEYPQYCFEIEEALDEQKP